MGSHKKAKVVGTIQLSIENFKATECYILDLKCPLKTHVLKA